MGISLLGIYTVPVVLLVVWQVVCWLGLTSSTTFASPIEVVKAGVHLWKVGEPSTLGTDIRISLTRACTGLVVGTAVGATAGAIAGLSKIGERAFNGPVQIMNAIPFLALLPLSIMWFGIGETSKVILIAVGAGIPVYINLFAAIRDIDQRLVEMAKAAGADRRRLFRRVFLPGSLPGGLVGLRFAIARSVLALVVVEQVNANSGIGFMINEAQTYQRVDEMFLGLVIYGIFGLTGDQIVRILERMLLRWRPAFRGGS